MLKEMFKKIDDIVGIALAFATYAGMAEANGNDFGFGSDSIDNRAKYLEWAKEFYSFGFSYGEDYYEEMERFFEKKLPEILT